MLHVSLLLYLFFDTSVSLHLQSSIVTPWFDDSSNMNTTEAIYIQLKEVGPPLSDHVYPAF